MKPANKEPAKPLCVLMVEDNPSDAHLLMHELKRVGREVRLDVVSTREGLLAALRGDGHDVVLSDYNLVGWNGLDVLRLMQEQGAPQPFILVTGSLGDEKTAECIKLGAADFVLKDRLSRLPFAVNRALEERALREQQLAAEQALRESEDRFRRLVQVSPEAIMVGCREQVVFINPAGLKLFGAQNEGQLLGKTMAELVHPDFQEGIRQRIERFQGTESATPAIEERFRRLDGTFVDVEVVAIPFLWEGQPAMQVVARDISERKKAEEALRQSEAALRSLVEHAPYAIYKTDVDRGRIVSANPALVAMLGYQSEAEVLALDLATQVYREPGARARLLPELERRGSFQGLELECKRKDGSLLTLRNSGRMVRDQKGERSVEAIGEDVTERRSLEQQLRQAQKMEAVGRLAGGVAHDFNNLLTVIRGYAELMLEESDLGKIRGRAQNIIKATDRTAALTRQLLAFSRKQVLWPQVLDLNAVMAEAKKMLPPLIGEDVQVVVIPGLKLGRVKADPGQLEQVLMNLTINARDAMPKGGKLVLETANVECDEGYCALHPGAQPGSYVMLAVSDNGSGMDPETQLHIFEPFFTTKPKDRGTGLGLATVYGIVKQSGGHVWVYSEPGIGTTFKVYLPRVEGKGAALSPPPRFEEKTAVTETILLVEDEEAVRRLARAFLEQRGYRVLEARNGADALKVAAGHAGSIHLLVTDMVMPGMRGLELAEKLSAVRPHIKVLFVSGYTDGSIVENGGLGEGSAFLEKPFSSDALARKVRQVLSGDGCGAERASAEAAEPAENGKRIRM